MLYFDVNCGHILRELNIEIFSCAKMSVIYFDFDLVIKSFLDLERIKLQIVRESPNLDRCPRAILGQS